MLLVGARFDILSSSLTSIEGLREHQEGRRRIVQMEETVAKIENLAASKYRNGNYSETVELLRRALRMREETAGHEIEKDEETLKSMTNLAGVYCMK